MGLRLFRRNKYGARTFWIEKEEENKKGRRTKKMAFLTRTMRGNDFSEEKNEGEMIFLRMKDPINVVINPPHFDDTYF